MYNRLMKDSLSNLYIIFLLGQSTVNEWDLKFRGRISRQGREDCSYFIPLYKFHLIVRVLEADIPDTLVDLNRVCDFCVKYFLNFKLILFYF